MVPRGRASHLRGQCNRLWALAAAVVLVVGEAVLPKPEPKLGPRAGVEEQVPLEVGMALDMRCQWDAARQLQAEASGWFGFEVLNVCFFAGSIFWFRRQQRFAGPLGPASVRGFVGFRALGLRVCQAHHLGFPIIASLPVAQWGSRFAYRL